MRTSGRRCCPEHLEPSGLKVDHETVRRWLLAAGQRTVRRRQQHRHWRERKASLGELVQLDGSPHDWFEGRRARCVLMVMVDDATNAVWAQFHAEETTRAVAAARPPARMDGAVARSPKRKKGDIFS